MKKLVKEILTRAIIKSGYDLPVGFDVSQPPNPGMGDYATNVALLIATRNSIKPIDCAKRIVENLSKESIREVSIAGPGFINFYLKQEIYNQEIDRIISEKNRYGAENSGKKRNYNVEYISANPTGPIHIGNARGGPTGEALVNLLKYYGNSVTRSFYVNDIGGQIDVLVESFYYWYVKSSGKEIPFPEGGYPGDYVKETVDEVIKRYKNELKKMKEKDDIISFFKDKGVKQMVRKIKQDAKLLGIEYDQFIYQSELEKTGATEDVIKTLEDRGATVKREGALWFKDDEEKNTRDSEYVLKKSDGSDTLTYFADDIACHKYKIDQGAEVMVDVLGPGHHSHIARMKASMRALGIDPERLKFIMYQNVRIKNGEEVIKMSKRQGNFVLLRDVIKSGVGPDAFKYIILSQNTNTPIDFDVKLAKDKSEKNPVYYIQYAHARICSILKKTGKIDTSDADLNKLKHRCELALVKELVRFKDIIGDAYQSLELQILPRYAYDLAATFHDFYTNCRVVEAEKDTMKARAKLIVATKTILKNTLDICAISTPEKM